jgi:hypothetical protein
MSQWHNHAYRCVTLGLGSASSNIGLQMVGIKHSFISLCFCYYPRHIFLRELALPLGLLQNRFLEWPLWGWPCSVVQTNNPSLYVGSNKAIEGSSCPSIESPRKVMVQELRGSPPSISFAGWCTEPCDVQLQWPAPSWLGWDTLSEIHKPPSTPPRHGLKEVRSSEVILCHRFGHTTMINFISGLNLKGGKIWIGFQYELWYLPLCNSWYDAIGPGSSCVIVLRGLWPSEAHCQPFLWAIAILDAHLMQQKEWLKVAPPVLVTGALVFQASCRDHHDVLLIHWSLQVSSALHFMPEMTSQVWLLRVGYKLLPYFLRILLF